MPKSVRVEFDDGTSHTYDNVPDDIDPQNVQDRAQEEFGDRRIANISENVAPEEKKAEPEPSFGAKAGSVLQTGYEIAKDAATSPLGMMAESALLGKKFVINPITEAIRAHGAATAPAQPVAPSIQVPPSTGGVPRPGVPGSAAQTFETLRAPTPSIPITPAAAEAAPAGQGLINQIGQRFAPLAQRVAPVLQGAGQALNVATPAMSFAMPYQMAAHEQEKIRANPTAPEYATNPYAMQQRGVAATQGQAGAMNQRNAVANQQYGGVTPQEQAVLEQDRQNRLDQMIRAAAAKKALAFPNQ